MKPLDDILLKFLTARFERSTIPQGFAEFVQANSSGVIITQSGSLIMRALLASYTKRLNLPALVPVTSQSENPVQPIQWCALNDQQALNKLMVMAPPLRVATLSVFERRGPIYNNPQNILSWRRLISIALGPRQLAVVLGQVRSLEALNRRSHKSMIRDLKLDFYRNLKLVRGTPFQPIDTQAQLVLQGADFEREIAILASRAKESPEAIRRRAQAEFRAIAANPRRFLYSIAGAVALFLTKRLFSEVTKLGLEHLTTANREHTVVIVPMHRSHLDYIVVGSSLYSSSLIPPVVAAGVNLRFGPFGFLIRSLGGYFVRRSSRNDRIHALVLKRYVNYLVKRGHLHEFFIEGGRSRSGRMRSPRLGLLSIMIQAFLRGQKREIQFVPVAISYENVVEDTSFGQENTGQGKKRESLRSLLEARHIFSRRYGQAIINFGQPVSLRQTMAMGISSERDLIQHVANELIQRIRNQTNPSLTSLASTALLLSPTYGLSRAELSLTIHNLGQLINIERSLNPSVGCDTTSLSHFLAGRDSILDDLVRSGVIQRDVVLGTELFYVPGKRRFIADFYKNATIHLLLPAAFLAVANLLDDPSASNSSVATLYEILARDYILPPQAQYIKHLSDVRSALQRAAIISDQGSFLNRSLGLYIPSLLWAPVQTLLWIFRNLESRESGLEGAISYSHLLTELQQNFRSAMYLRIVTRTEAGALSSIESALDALRDRGVISITEGRPETRELRLLRPLDGERSFLQKIDRALRETIYRPKQ